MLFVLVWGFLVTSSLVVKSMWHLFRCCIHACAQIVYTQYTNVCGIHAYTHYVTHVYMSAIASSQDHQRQSSWCHLQIKHRRAPAHQQPWPSTSSLSQWHFSSQRACMHIDTVGHYSNVSRSLSMLHYFQCHTYCSIHQASHLKLQCHMAWTSE